MTDEQRAAQIAFFKATATLMESYGIAGTIQVRLAYKSDNGALWEWLHCVVVGAGTPSTPPHEVMRVNR